jgi:hypothetical protein
MMNTTPMMTVHSATAAQSVRDEDRSMPPRASFRRSIRYSRSSSWPPYRVPEFAPSGTICVRA